MFNWNNFQKSWLDLTTDSVNHVFFMHMKHNKLFLPVSHCFSAWSKINLKVYDTINCLNKNLIIHLVWYPEKEKRYGTESLSIDRVLSTQNSHCMQEILLGIQYSERRLSKSFEKLILFFLLNPVPFNGQSSKNQKGLGTSDPVALQVTK